MSAMHAAQSTIRISRIARAGLDACLLLALLGLFIQLKLLSESHDSNVHNTQYLANVWNKKKSRTSEITSIAHIEEIHDSESGMWTSFFEWQSTSNHAAGSCRFTPTDGFDPGKFHLLCSGENPQPGFSIKIEPAQIFVEKKIKSPDSKSDTHKPFSQQTPSEKPLIIEGWLDTPTGRKYFDPVSNSWKP